MSPEACVGCGRDVTTPYCPVCGERRASDRSVSLLHFLRDNVFEAVATFDGRAIRTYKTLLARPGELTVQFMRGARLKFLSPLQCFLILNVALFIWSSAQGHKVFDTPLSVHLHNTLYNSTAVPLVERKIEETHLSREMFEDRFNRTSSAADKSLVLAMVPGFALFTALITSGRRRRYAVQHLVFSLHFYSFLFVLFPLAIYTTIGIGRLILEPLHIHIFGNGGDGILSTTLALGAVSYLAIAFARAYGFGRVRAVLSAVASFGAVFMVLQGYRILLFFVTIWSM